MVLVILLSFISPQCKKCSITFTGDIESKMEELQVSDYNGEIVQKFRLIFLKLFFDFIRKFSVLALLHYLSILCQIPTNFLLILIIDISYHISITNYKDKAGDLDIVFSWRKSNGFQRDLISRSEHLTKTTGLPWAKDTI